MSEPLRALIKDAGKNQFKWEQRHEQAFQDIKQGLLAGTVLSYYNKEDETIVICDASPYGLGAVLLQKG